MASYDTEVAADSPAIYWKLQDTSGTTATDSSGNSRPGTYNGTASTNYALNQSVSLLPADPTLKSVKFMRDSAVESGHPTTRSNLADGSTVNGKASVSRAYEAWMNAAGAAFSVEAWVKVPATLNRYAPNYGLAIAARRSTSPLQWELRLASFGAIPFIYRWEAAVSAMGQPVYGASLVTTPETAFESALGGGNFEQAIEDVSGYTRYGDWVDGLAHHIVAAAGTGSLRVYGDGVLGASYFASGLPAIASNTADPICFGGIATTGNMAGFLGWMSHCACYGSELSAARIAAHYTAGAAKVTFLNQQWQLFAADQIELTSSVSVADTCAYIGAYPMELNDDVTAGVDMMPVIRTGISLAASAAAATLTGYNSILQVALLDAASITSAMTGSKFMQFMFNEIVGVQAALGLNARMSMNISDVVTAAVVIKAGDAEYVGWIINPNLAASTAAEGLNFLSMARHRGKYYGLKADGLYRLGGDTDAGQDINAFISLAQTNFGAAQFKRVPYAYIGAATDGRMLLRVLADGKEYTYQVRNPSEGMAEQRIDIGKGLKANYWQFELMNQNGEDFDLDTVKFMPIVLERKI